MVRLNKWIRSPEILIVKNLIVEFQQVMAAPGGQVCRSREMSQVWTLKHFKIEKEKKKGSLS